MRKTPGLFRIITILSIVSLLFTGCEKSLRDQKEEARREREQTESASLQETEEEQGEESAKEEPERNETEAVTEADLPVNEEETDPEPLIPEEEETVSEEEIKEDAPVLDKYRELLSINPYVAGWLKIDDTVIDEPVVYTPASQNYFLHRAIDGSDLSAGSLFIAINWSRDTNHTLIYGHNMKDGTAFGSLLKFADEAYGRSHPVIRFDTLYEEEEYQLYAVFYSQIDEEELETEEDRAQADQAIEENSIAKKAEEEGLEVTPKELTLNDIDLHMDFGDEDIFRQEKDEDNGRFRYYYFTDLSDLADFEYYANNVKERALYDMGIEAEWGDRFVTLSTCSYQVKNGRFVVVGIKKQNF